MTVQNWYSNGNADWDAPDAWNTQADGGGTDLTDPDTDAHVIIQGSDTITITKSATIKSLTIDSGSDLDGNASYTITTTSEGDATYGSQYYAVKINGTTDTNVNIEIQGTFDTRVDLDGTMGNLTLTGSGEKEFRGTPTIGGNVVIEGSCPVLAAGAVEINGNLTITSGEYDTGSHALTVTGDVTLVAGDLLLNASATTIGGDWASTGGGEMTGTTHVDGLIVLGNWRAAGSAFNNADGKVVFKEQVEVL